MSATPAMTFSACMSLQSPSPSPSLTSSHEQSTGINAADRWQRPGRASLSGAKSRRGHFSCPWPRAKAVACLLFVLAEYERGAAGGGLTGRAAGDLVVAPWREGATNTTGNGAFASRANGPARRRLLGERTLLSRQVDPDFVITEENFEEVVGSFSNGARELVFTTFTIYPFPNGTLSDTPGSGMTAFNGNLARHLHRAGVREFLLVGLTEAACARTRAVGVACYVDALPWLREVKVYNGRQVVLKWLYMRKMVELGFHPLFLDNDAAVLKDPLHHWERSFDFQALSDARTSPEGDVPALAKDLACGVNYGALRFPCASTGVLYVRATEATRAFLRSFVVKIERAPSKWEQAAFQRAVLPFLMQVGDGPPALRFRLLPIERFHNVKDMRRRQLAGREVDSVIVHCGYIRGGVKKRIALERAGLWLGARAARQSAAPNGAA